MIGPNDFPVVVANVTTVEQTEHEALRMDRGIPVLFSEYFNTFVRTTLIFKLFKLKPDRSPLCCISGTFLQTFPKMTESYENLRFEQMFPIRV